MPFDNTTCASYMRGLCAIAKAKPRQPLLRQGPCGESSKNGRVSCNHVNQTVAAFLIVRPELAWVGNGWESDDAVWNEIY